MVIFELFRLQGRFVIGEGPSGKRNFDIKTDKLGAGVWCVPLKDQNHSWFTGITANGTFKVVNGNPNFQIFRIAFFDLDTHFTLKIPYLDKIIQK